MSQVGTELLPLTLHVVATPERTQVGLLSLLVAARVTMVEQAPSLTDFFGEAGSNSPELLLIDTYEGEELDYTLVDAIRHQYPSIAMIILAPRHRRGILDRLYRLGVRAFITEDVGLPALVDALNTIRSNPNVFIVRIGG